jgi:hypothetical protein
MKLSFQHYLEFKQAFRLKEYPCLIGFFLKVFGLAVAIRDEKRKIHYVRKSSLMALGAKYDFPYLNKTIFLDQIKPRKAAGIRWNLLEMERCGINALQMQKIEELVKPLMVKDVVDQKFKKNGDQLPLSVFIADGRFFLSLSKKKAGLAGKGGQRLIKFAYDLTKGCKVVRKRILPQEMEAIDCLRGIPGIAKTEAVFEGNVLFEKYYAGTLKNLIESGRVLSPAEVLQISKDLMTAVSEIHNRKTKDGRPAFHSDIKLDNLFYRPSKKRGIEVVIGDLGFANSDGGVCGTCSWFSPEYAREMLDREHEKKFDQLFNRRYGQALDLWSIGLVIASLLIQDGRGRLSCLRFSANRQKTLQKILKVDQMKIDQEIAVRQYQEKDEHLKALWNVVGALLKIDPHQRVKAASALQHIRGPA